MKEQALYVLRLFGNLIVLAAKGNQSGGLRLLLQHVAVIGPQQWLWLVAALILARACGIWASGAAQLQWWLPGYRLYRLPRSICGACDC